MKKYILPISIIIILLIVGFVYYTHRSVDQELTGEDLELKELLVSESSKEKEEPSNDKTDSEVALKKPDNVKEIDSDESKDTGVKVLKKGEFNPDVPGSDSLHRAWGRVQIVDFKGQKKIVFGDDFRVTNAPDLFIYLVKEGNVEDGDLFERSEGKLMLTQMKQFSGYQLYDIPEDVNIDEYKGVVIWCESFGQFMSNANIK